MVRVAIVFLLLLSFLASGAWAEEDNPLAPVAFLVGEYSGEGKHPYGAYQETQAGVYSLGKSVIEVRTKSTMQGSTVHEDLRVISWDEKAHVLRMRQWAKKVLRIYTGTVGPKGSVTFEETAHEGKSGERWRYTFAPRRETGFTYAVQVDKGSGWKPFVSGTLSAEVKDPGTGGGLGIRQYEAEIDGMRAQIHHPDGKGPYPAMVFSPGADASSCQGYRPYGRWYATWGFITVIVAFNDKSALERAPKFSKVLDWLIKENGRDGAPLKGMVDVHRLGVGGHSRGGNAAIRAGRSDTRVSACLAFAPASPYDGLSDKNTCPLCVIIGDEDEFVAAATKAAKDAPGPAYLFIIAGMSHMLGPREATLKLVARSTSFLNYALKGDVRYETFLTGETAGLRHVDLGR